MATWESAMRYILGKYEAELLDDGDIELKFALPDGRRQIVFVGWSGQDAANATWLDFSSPIAEIGTIPLERLLFATRTYVAGGLTSIGSRHVGLRVSVPLENLDRNEIDEPMKLVCLAADALEAEFTGGDQV